MAEASAFSWVVTTADIHDGTAPPFSLAARSAIALSRGIAEAGTGEPGTATVVRSLVNRTLPLPQPAIIRPANTTATHDSVTILRVSLPMATRRIAPDPRLRRSKRSARCTTCLSDDWSVPDRTSTDVDGQIAASQTANVAARRGADLASGRRGHPTPRARTRGAPARRHDVLDNPGGVAELSRSQIKAAPLRGAAGSASAPRSALRRHARRTPSRSRKTQQISAAHSTHRPDTRSRLLCPRPVPARSSSTACPVP